MESFSDRVSPVDMFNTIGKQKECFLQQASLAILYLAILAQQEY